MMARPLRTMRQAGLTLLELMVTMLLASILISGLFYMMSGQQKTYTNQVAVLSAQENLWGAMEYLERQIRMAGYGFGSCGSKILTVGSGTGDASVAYLHALEIRNNNNLFTTAADGTDSFSMRASATSATGQQNLRVTKEHPISSSTMWVSSIGTLDPLVNGDLIVVCLPGFPGTLMELTKAPELSNDNDGDGVDDYKLIMNPSGTYNPPGGVWTKLFGPGAKYPANTSVVKFGTSMDPRHFAIDNTHNPPRLVTWTLTNKSDLEIVASGIEDMQIAWACDTESVPGNGVFTEGACIVSGGGVSCKCSTDDCSAKVGDEWANNVASDTDPMCNDNPIQRVRITLIARTDAPVVADRRGKRPEAEDHYEGTPAQDLTATGDVGTYARAVLTSTVVPRNIRIKQ
jgi:type IV pilus assembly protein PilW